MVTIKNIAKDLGLNHSTVSRILNDRSGMKYKKETIKMVKDYACKHNYKKNSVAAGLKNGKVGLIGVIVPDVGIPFFGKLASAIDFELKNYGYRILLANSGNSCLREKENIEEFMAYQVDGIIYSPYSTQSVLVDSRVPIVTVDNCISDKLNFIGLDTKKTFKTMTSTLENKYQKIGVVCYETDKSRREKDFLSCATEKLSILSAPQKYRREKDSSDQIEWLLKAECDILVGISERTTINMILYLKSKGDRILRNIGMTGFLDSKWHDCLDIFGIRQPVEKYAETAVKVLLAIIDKKIDAPKKYTFPGELIIPNFGYNVNCSEDQNSSRKQIQKQNSEKEYLKEDKSLKIMQPKKILELLNFEKEVLK